MQIEKQIEKVVYYLKYYDENKVLPFDKKRVDVTLSFEVLDKLKNKNKSKFIEGLINEKI